MQIVSQIVFEKGDMELLKNCPADPCVGCFSKGECCGCDNKRDWVEEYGTKLKEANLMDAFSAYQKFLCAQQAVNAAKKKLQAARAFCVEKGFDIGGNNMPYPLD